MRTDCWQSQLPRRLLTRWLMAITVVFAGQGTMSAFAQKTESTPEFGLRFLHDQPDHRFRDITLDKIPVELQQSLQATALRLFRAEALPFAYRAGNVELVPGTRPTDAKIRVFTAGTPRERDLVEVTWIYRGVPLRWIMSANVDDVQFPLRPFREGAATDVSGMKVSAYVGDILRLDGEIPDVDRNFKVELPWPETLSNDVSLSSNSKIPFTSVTWWFDRWDVIVKNEAVHILIYSRNPQVAGFDDGSKYFPSEFRKQMLAKPPKTP